MREIKFKVWDKEKKRMSKPLPLFCPIIKWNDGDIDMPTDFALAKNRFVFIQYTGLKDKRGKEIYEGDIVKWEQSLITAGIPKKPRTRIDIVECFTLAHCQPLSIMNLDKKKRIKIIGNIYENSALLKK